MHEGSSFNPSDGGRSPAPGVKHTPADLGGSESAAKRAHLAAADLDIEKLVSQLSESSLPAPPLSGGSSGGSSSQNLLLLEEQLQGAVEALQRANPPSSLPPSCASAEPLDEPTARQPMSEQYRTELASQLALSPPALQTRSAAPPAPGDNLLVRTRCRCLPMLDSLACQILDTLSNGHHQETLNTVTQCTNDRGRAYHLLVDIFQQTKRLYTTDAAAPFIAYDDPLGLEPTSENRNVLQRANLATYCAALFGSIQVGFVDLHKWFLSVFVPKNGRLLKSQASLFLEIKTQAYISALSQPDVQPKQVLDELFPEDLADQLLRANSDRQTLSPGEQDLVSRCSKRRDNIGTETDQLALARTYKWVFFLREVIEYIAKQHYTLLPVTAATAPAKEPEAAATAPRAAEAPAKGGHDGASTGGEGAQPASPAHPRRTRRDLGEEAKKAASHKQLQNTDTLAAYEAARSSAEGMEAARPNKSSVFTRRIWTKQEEEALLKGLDRVQGPYWAQILELYGPGGSISEVLKDRTQVQLKDKARNLKMFFVRCGLPIPAVFQYVTGDYETRRSAGRRSREKKKSEEHRPPQPSQAAHAGIAMHGPHAVQDASATARYAAPLDAHAASFMKGSVGGVAAQEEPGPFGREQSQAAGRGPPSPATQQLPGAHAAAMDMAQVPSADALDRALSIMKGSESDENNIQRLLQSVGDYINNK